MENIVVSDIMTRNPVTIEPNANLLDCAKLMVKKRVGSLLLVDKKRLVGFISSDDILWALVKKSKKDLSLIKAVEVAIKKIATIKPNTPVKIALQKMKKLKFRRLPVIHEKELVGIVTIRDILSFHPEIYPELSEIEMLKEEQEKLKRIQKAKNREFMHEGICEDCGNRDILFRVDGRLICESCRDSM